MNNECKAVIKELEKELFDLQEQQNSKDDFKKHIDEIRRVLNAAQKDAANGIISKEFVNKYIDKIFVTPEDDTLKLEIKIFTGKMCEKYLKNIRSRTGQMSKIMCPPFKSNKKWLSIYPYRVKAWVSKNAQNPHKNRATTVNIYSYPFLWLSCTV